MKSIFIFIKKDQFGAKLRENRGFYPILDQFITKLRKNCIFRLKLSDLKNNLFVAKIDFHLFSTQNRIFRKIQYFAQKVVFLSIFDEKTPQNSLFYPILAQNTGF